MKENEHEHGDGTDNDCRGCVALAADQADALRADHMAEMHVGEPNEACDLCEK